MSSTGYLVEARKRLFHYCYLLFALLTVCIIFSNQLYSFIAKPVINLLPENGMLITTSVTGGFMIPIQLSIYVAVFFSFPFLCYQIWTFISPALYTAEKKKFFPFLIMSNIFFYLSIIFGIYLIAPMALKFFMQTAPSQVTVMLEIANYLEFIIKIAFGCAIAFQIPVLLMILIKAGIIEKTHLIQFRRYFIVIALIVGMLCTPPDVISQLMLALPLIALYELVIVFS